MDIRNFFSQMPAQPSGKGKEPAEMTPAAEPRTRDAPVSGAEPRAAIGVGEGEGEGTGLNADNAVPPDHTVSPAATTSGGRPQGAVDAEPVPMELETTAPPNDESNGLAAGLPAYAAQLTAPAAQSPANEPPRGSTTDPGVASIAAIAGAELHGVAAAAASVGGVGGDDGGSSVRPMEEDAVDSAVDQSLVTGTAQQAAMFTYPPDVAGVRPVTATALDDAAAIDASQATATLEAQQSSAAAVELATAVTPTTVTASIPATAAAMTPADASGTAGTAGTAGAAEASGPEKKYDVDNKAYTLDQFIAYYGGTVNKPPVAWHNALRKPRATLAAAAAALSTAISPGGRPSRNSAKHQCSECNERFRLPNQLDKHLKMHRKERKANEAAARAAADAAAAEAMAAEVAAAEIAAEAAGGPLLMRGVSSRLGFPGQGGVPMSLGQLGGPRNAKMGSASGSAALGPQLARQLARQRPTAARQPARAPIPLQMPIPVYVPREPLPESEPVDYVTLAREQAEVRAAAAAARVTAKAATKAETAASHRAWFEELLEYYEEDGALDDDELAQLAKTLGIEVDRAAGRDGMLRAIRSWTLDGGTTLPITSKFAGQQVVNGMCAARQFNHTAVLRDLPLVKDADDLLRLYGTTELPAQVREFSAGPLTARVDLRTGGILSLKWGTAEFCLGISYTATDHHDVPLAVRLLGDPVIAADEDEDAWSMAYTAAVGGPNLGLCVSIAIRVSPPGYAADTGTAADVGDVGGEGGEGSALPGLTITSELSCNAELPIKIRGAGLCMSLPGELAACSVRLKHANGDAAVANFPDFVDPDSPFRSLLGLEYTLTNAVKATYTFEGTGWSDPPYWDVEDARQWADTSFRFAPRAAFQSYGAEVDEIRDGPKQQQSLRLEFTPTADALVPPWEHRTDGPVEITLESPRTEIRVPPICVGIPSGGELGEPPDMLMTDEGPRKAGADVIERALGDSLRAVGCQRFQARYNRADGHGLSQLEMYKRLSVRAEMHLVLELVVPAPVDFISGSWKDEVIKLYQDVDRVELWSKVCAVVVVPVDYLRSPPAPGDLGIAAPTEGGLHPGWGSMADLSAHAFHNLLAAARHALHQRDKNGRIKLLSGGLTSFTDLNRRRPAPGTVDGVTHSAGSIVHACGDEHVLRTARGLQAIGRTVRNLYPGAEYWIGPTSIAIRGKPFGRAAESGSPVGPSFDPATVLPAPALGYAYAAIPVAQQQTEPAGNPHQARAMRSTDDPRARGCIGAAFSLALMSQMADQPMGSLGVGDAMGPRGLATLDTADEDQAPLWYQSAYHASRFGRQRGGRLKYYPAFHVVRGLSRASGAILWKTSSSDTARVCVMAFHVPKPLTVQDPKRPMSLAASQLFSGNVKRSSVSSADRRHLPPAGATSRTPSLAQHRIAFTDDEKRNAFAASFNFVSPAISEPGTPSTVPGTPSFGLSHTVTPAGSPPPLASPLSAASPSITPPLPALLNQPPSLQELGYPEPQPQPQRTPNPLNQSTLSGQPTQPTQPPRRPSIRGRKFGEWGTMDSAQGEFNGEIWLGNQTGEPQHVTVPLGHKASFSVAMLDHTAAHQHADHDPAFLDHTISSLILPHGDTHRFSLELPPYAVARVVVTPRAVSAFETD